MTIFSSRVKSQKALCRKGLFAGLLNSNCNGNGHTNHGVVAGADETHHLNVKMTVVEENVLTIRKFLIIEHITHLICQPHYIIFCDVCQDVEGVSF
jgi:hypothetical protein